MGKGLSNYWGYSSIGYLAPHALYAATGARRRAGARVQGDGEGAPPGGDRGDPRRRLQPHRRGEPPRADAVVQGHRQPELLPLLARRPPLLRGLHGHRQQPQPAPPERAAPDHGQPALLGARDARRRLPVRPRLRPGAGVLGGQPPLGVLRHHPPGPGALPGEADRRALGRRAGRLPGGQLPGPLDRVERRLPRRDARLLARPERRRGRVRVAADGLERPVPVGRPPPVRLDQLRDRARRLHHARPRLLQPEAQRGQPRGQPRRHRRQPQLELRRRGPHGRPPDPRAAGPAAPQPPGDPAAVAGGADAARRRRDGPQPGRQQQRLLPGQRDQLVRLGARRGAGGPAGVHAPADRPAQGASGLPPARLLRGPRRATGRACRTSAGSARTAAR